MLYILDILDYILVESIGKTSEPILIRIELGTGGTVLFFKKKKV